MFAHHAADEVVAGIYWTGGRGCFIGCAVHGQDPSPLIEETDIPLVWIRTAEAIFEGLARMYGPERSRDFFRDVTKAGVVDGKDYSKFHWRFMRAILTRCQIHHVDYSDESVVRVIGALSVIIGGGKIDGRVARVMIEDTHELDLGAAQQIAWAIEADSMRQDGKWVACDEWHDKPIEQEMSERMVYAMAGKVQEVTVSDLAGSFLNLTESS